MVRELTYFAPRKCYKKKRNGQVYYVGHGSMTDTDENYRRARAEWEAKLADLVTAEKLRKSEQMGSMSERLKRAKDRRNAGLPPFTADDYRYIWAHSDDGDERRAFANGPLRTLVEHLQPEVEAATEPAKTDAQPSEGHTLGKTIDKFLGHKATQARTGMLKGGGRTANLQSNLKTLRDVVGESTPMEKLDAAVLADYYNHLLELVAEQEISSTTAAEKMQAAKQFIRWAWGLGLCELPRNIDSKEQVIFRSLKPVEPMPPGILRELVKAATGRLKLELLLMANCGFYQSDCAELKHTEVDWDKGTITRQRSKRTRGKDQDVPTVTYYLWPTTLQLLRANASTDSELVLPNENGVASVRSSIGDNGKVGRTDNFRMAYDRLVAKLAEKYEQRIAKMDKSQISMLIDAGELEKVEGKVRMRAWSAKTIRKASATAIANHEKYSRFAQYFLGQSPRTVADKHYIKPSGEQFRECLHWLGEFYGFLTVEGIGTLG